VSGEAGGLPIAWQVARDTIGDTIVVRTLGGSVWGDAQLIEEVRVGQFDGPEELTFGDIAAIAMGLDGTVYVLDRQGPSLRAYSPAGEYLRDLGRAGEGPGELKQPDSGLAILPDGRVLVRDPGNARITVFHPDGAYDTEWRIRGSSSTSTPLYVDREGGVYQQLFEFGDDGLRFSLVRYGLDGQPGDTLVIPPSDDLPQLTALSSDGGSRSSTTVPFWPRRPTTLSLDGDLVMGHSGTYSIDIPQGDGVLRIQRAYEPVPVLPDEQANWRERTTHNMRRTQPGWDWDGPPIPDKKPAFRDLRFDSDGRLWVQLYSEAEPIPQDEIEPAEPGSNEAPPRRWREPVRFDVFDVDGTYLGVLDTPRGFRASPQPAVRGNVMWAVVRDQLDVPYLVRFRIVPEPDRP